MLVASSRAMAQFQPLGSFGCDLVKNEGALDRTVSLVNRPGSFLTARPMHVCCMDDRPAFTLPSYANVPGAEVLLVMMCQFICGGSFADNLARLKEMGYHFHRHPDCYGRGHADRVLKEVMADPTHELLMIERLGLGKAFAPEVHVSLGEWLGQLPPNFVASGAIKLPAESPQPAAPRNPIMAILNRQTGTTFAQQAAVPRATNGFTAFAIDWWFGNTFAHELLDYAGEYDYSRTHYSCLVAIFRLMCAGFLRQVGSKNLALCVM